MTSRLSGLLPSCPLAAAVRSLLSSEEKRGRSYQQQASTAGRPLEVAPLFVVAGPVVS